jgi:cell division protein FtsL
MMLLDRKVRGFRLVDLVALGLLTLLILGVYLAKTVAGRERAEIASVERQIGAEKARIRLLTAEVTHLEQPARIERLSTTYLGMAPVDRKRETTTDALASLARRPAPVILPTTPVATAAQAAPEFVR